MKVPSLWEFPQGCLTLRERSRQLLPARLVVTVEVISGARLQVAEPTGRRLTMMRVAAGSLLGSAVSVLPEQAVAAICMLEDRLERAAQWSALVNGSHKPLAESMKEVAETFVGTKVERVDSRPVCRIGAEVGEPAPVKGTGCARPR
jgi:hypothetical protein